MRPTFAAGSTGETSTAAWRRRSNDRGARARLRTCCRWSAQRPSVAASRCRTAVPYALRSYSAQRVEVPVRIDGEARHAVQPRAVRFGGPGPWAEGQRKVCNGSSGRGEPRGRPPAGVGPRPRESVRDGSCRARGRRRAAAWQRPLDLLRTCWAREAALPCAYTMPLTSPPWEGITLYPVVRPRLREQETCAGRAARPSVASWVDDGIGGTSRRGRHAENGAIAAGHNVISRAVAPARVGRCACSRSSTTPAGRPRRPWP